VVQPVRRTCSRRGERGVQQAVEPGTTDLDSERPRPGTPASVVNGDFWIQIVQICVIIIGQPQIAAGSKAIPSDAENGYREGLPAGREP